MSAADVDVLLPAPLVVLGSLPPQGRDLDLLVPEETLPQLRSTFHRHGWVTGGDTFVRFAEGTAFSVDLVPLETWLPNVVARAGLLREASTIPGYRHLRAPCPPHRLLLLAHRLDRGMIVDERRAARLAAYEADSWERARDEAVDWDLADALEQLRRAAGDPARHAVRRIPGTLHRRRARVISLSGLDGSGKSTQAEHLLRALAALGYDANVSWTKLGRDPVLDRVSAPAKAVLDVVARVRRRPAVVSERRPTDPADESGEVRIHPGGPRPEPDSGHLARDRSAVLSWGWGCVVALANAHTHRRTARAHPGAVLICDRYVLDSAAHLRYRYPSMGRPAVQRWLVRRLSPSPLAAFFLDVSPAAARARKPEQYTTSDLTRLRNLYVDECGRLKVTVVDGERPESEVAAALAEQAWRALTRPGRLGAFRALRNR